MGMSRKRVSQLDDNEIVAEVRAILDRDAEVNCKRGTCGACTKYSAKIFYGLGDSDKGKCFGWLEDDRDSDGIAIARWTESVDTCVRYEEDTSRLERMEEFRFIRESRMINSRRRPVVDVC